MAHKSDHHNETPASSTTADASAMADSLLAVGGAVPFDKTSAEEENRFHHYVGNEIPWFIRGVWVLFWCFAIAYIVVWLIPSLQSELLSPP
ncbi:MAG TPA: hypothetical protein VJY33_00595 [Isosphaeraceae bacterium]|nr:hypothetical protein [Isosphaeraceae bacterium]